MNAFVRFSREEQRLYYDQASAKLNLPAPAIEKDFWVCWTLSQLFSIPEWRSHLTFKGGTSLSKVWNLIQRFSEDIDLTISRDFLGLVDTADPERADTSSQKQKRIKQLKSSARTRVRDDLLPRFRETVAQGLPAARADDIRLDETDADNITILFRYPRVTPDESLGAMLPDVKIEMGPRGDDWPANSHQIVPYLEQALPGTLSDQATIEVHVLDAERTFLEKAMLLHEDYFRPPEKPRKPRMARHYYDLFRMIIAGVGDRAMSSASLLDRVREHRRFYYPISWVDYSTMTPGRFRFVPPPESIATWEADYEAMRDIFFFGPAPDFDEMMDVVRGFQDKINGSTVA